MNSSSNVQSNLGTLNRFPSFVSVELEGVLVQRDKQFLNAASISPDGLPISRAEGNLPKASSDDSEVG